MTIVYGTARLAEDSVDRNQAAPASTIRIPNRLSGLRHQATAPARTKARIPQTASPACTPGSGMWSLVRARSTVHEAAATPKATTAQRTAVLGARATPVVGSRAAMVSMPQLPFCLGIRPDETFQAHRGASTATDGRRRRRRG